METTTDTSDDLLRRATAEAALDRCNLNDLVAAGLRLVLAAPRSDGRPANTGANPESSYPHVEVARAPCLPIRW